MIQNPCQFKEIPTMSRCSFRFFTISFRYSRYIYYLTKQEQKIKVFIFFKHYFLSSFSLDKGGTNWTLSHLIWVGLLIFAYGIHNAVSRDADIISLSGYYLFLALVSAGWNGQHRTGTRLATLPPCSPTSRFHRDVW